MKIERTILMAAAAILLAAGCAKEKETPANEAEKRYFDAWMEINHPGLEPTDHWVYIIEEEPGDASAPVKEDYVFVTYTIKDLQGNVSSTNDRKTAEQLNQYEPQNYYGPAVWNLENIMAGVSYAIEGMNIDGFRSVIIPGWLMSYQRYSTEEAYLANVTGSSNAIYDIRVTGQTDDITQWQIDEMSDFVDRDPLDLFREITPKDSTETGFYYEGIIVNEDGTETVDTPALLEQLLAAENPDEGDDSSEDSTGEDEEEKDDPLAVEEDKSLFPSDTTVYINYTGRLMNGQVFDTTIENTAKDHNIYSWSKTYEPMPVSWGDSYAALQLDGNSVISGFAKTLWRMSRVKGVKKAVGLFYSDFGYGYSGSGDMIPGYAPLIFEIEFTEDPED